MIGLGALAFVTPFGRSFFDLFLPKLTVVLESLALGGAGAVAVELWVRTFGRRPVRQ
jgi:hypothetical protein